MPPVIDARSLTKSYGGRKGIEDLTFSVERGEIYGYLGPNGAGKTTTIRLMLDFVRPSRGHIDVLGVSSRRGRDVRRRVGYLPGELGLYDESTGLKSLDLYGKLSGGYTPLRDWVCDALQLTRDDLKRRIRHYSKGMKQKLGIVQAIQHDPELLILDEPTSGLDPVVQARFFEVLREFRRRGRTVFFSSHILSEVEHLCDRVGVLREGRLVLDAKLSELTVQTDRLLYVRFAAPGTPPHVEIVADVDAATAPASEAAPLAAQQIPGARHFREEGEWSVYAVSPRDVPELIQYLAHVRPIDFRLESALGESFLQLYGVGGPSSK